MKLDDYLSAGNTVKIGHWWTQCCERDMSKIETEADIQEALNSFLPARLWESERDALLDLMPENLEGEDKDYWDDLLAHAVVHIFTIEKGE